MQPPLKKAKFGFNTQPPEGGWTLNTAPEEMVNSFNTQPPEGGWSVQTVWLCPIRGFNTQPPEGGWGCPNPASNYGCRFNTQPPEGGWGVIFERASPSRVSTHSRPKAAGSSTGAAGAA